MPWLKLLVMASACWCVVAIGFLFQRTKGYGARKLFAPAAGDPKAGVRYAFTLGLLPGAKESVREHPMTWALGMVFHTGIFTSFAYLALLLAGQRATGWVLIGFQVLLALGAAAGITLLLKRAFLPNLRGLSHPDDYLANCLPSALCSLAFLHGFMIILEPWLLGLAALLFLYAPLGKIRHCLFFFPTRFHFGAFFGRRGVYPPASPKA